MPELILLPGKEKSLLRRHPWIFAGSVATLKGRARAGDTIDILSARGDWLGRGAFSPDSQIRARVWTFKEDETVDHAFFRRKIANAVAYRQSHPHLAQQEGKRLIHGESDGLPGVIADQYGDTIVVQLTSAGADKWRNAIFDALIRSTGALHIYERSDSDVRKMEGFSESVTGWQHGPYAEGAAAPEQRFSILENGVRLEVDPAGGHKTGFYLDQRDNRYLTGQLAKDRKVLNCFCYTGGFSLQALAGGAASVLSIDSSGPAIEGAKRNLALNPQLPADRAEWWEADVFKALRELKAKGETFDLIILDPPKFAPSSRHADQAARAYKDINLHGFKLLNPGGILMTYSCSGGIGLELFQSIIAGAAKDAGVDARIIQRLQAAPDHPIGLAVPEGEYLKGLACQIQ